MSPTGKAADLESGAFLEQGGGLQHSLSFVPRVDPPIDNGLLIRFTIWGEPLFTVESTLLTLNQFSDTLINEYEFLKEWNSTWSKKQISRFRSI